MSKALRAERDRVLKGLDNICRRLIPSMHHSSILTDLASRFDIYGGGSKLSTARNWFDDDAADWRRDRSTRAMRICPRDTGGSPAVYQVRLRGCRPRSDPPGCDRKHASAVSHR